MATTLTATFKSSVYYSLSDTDSLGIVAPDQNTDQFSLTLSNGTGANGTADLKFSALYTLAGAATQDIDLAASLVSRFGATLTFARLKAIHIRVLSSTNDATSLGGPVDVGGGTNPLVNWISVGSTKVRIGGTAGRGGCLQLACDDAVAYAVTAGTGDILRLTNVSATLSVKVAVVLIGSSA